MNKSKRPLTRTTSFFFHHDQPHWFDYYHSVFFHQPPHLFPGKKIRKLTQRIRAEEFEEGRVEFQGDELNEFGNICHVIDKKLKNRHNELELKIQEATEDLYATTLNLKQANEELTALNTAKTEFFSDISHELRTPLTSIKGAADILIRKSSCSDPVYLDIIKNNTDHLIRIILDFLDYSRIEADKLELDYTHESLTDIIREVIDARKAEAWKDNSSLSLTPQGILRSGWTGIASTR